MVDLPPATPTERPTCARAARGCVRDPIQHDAWTMEPAPLIDCPPRSSARHRGARDDRCREQLDKELSASRSWGQRHVSRHCRQAPQQPHGHDTRRVINSRLNAAAPRLRGSAPRLR